MSTSPEYLPSRPCLSLYVMPLARIFFLHELVDRWEEASEPSSSRNRPVPQEKRERADPAWEVALWAQSGQMSCRTFQPPGA